MSLVLANPPIIQNAYHPDAENRYVSLSGANQVAEQTITASSSSPNGGTTTFTIRPPSSDVIVNKVFLLSVDVTMAATHNADIQMARACLQSYPLNSAIQNLQVFVNGNQLAVEPSRLKSIWERIAKNSQFKNKYNSMTPTKRDGDLNFRDDAINNSGKSPFAKTRERMGDEPSRFEWCMNNNKDANPVSRSGNATEADAHAISRTFTIVEPLMLGDLLLAAGEDGFYNVDKIEISITWVSNLVNYMISDPRTVAVNTAASPFGNIAPENLGSHRVADSALLPTTWAITLSNQKLYVQYVTPSIQLPPTYVSPFHRVVRYTQNGHLNLAAGVSDTVTMNVIQDSMVPDTIIVAVRRPQSGRTQFISDSFMPISEISLTVGNDVGVKSTATQEQLYLMSVNNGYMPTYNEFKNKGQGFVILRCGKDIGGVVPGAKGQFSIQLRVKYTNPYANAVTAEIDVFFIKAATITLSPNSCIVQEGFDISEVAVAEEGPSVYLEESENAGDKRTGAGFGSFFRRYIRPAAQIGATLASTMGPNIPTRAAGLAMRQLLGGNSMVGGNKLIS